jgi:hypothetical protein
MTETFHSSRRDFQQNSYRQSTTYRNAHVPSEAHATTRAAQPALRLSRSVVASTGGRRESVMTTIRATAQIRLVGPAPTPTGRRTPPLRLPRAAAWRRLRPGGVPQTMTPPNPVRQQRHYRRLLLKNTTRSTWRHNARTSRATGAEGYAVATLGSIRRHYLDERRRLPTDEHTPRPSDQDRAAVARA